MPYYRAFKTRCSHCGWRGTVGFGDVRVGPWKQPNGTYVYHELACPTCRKQVDNPLSAEERASFERESSVPNASDDHAVAPEPHKFLEGDELTKEIARLLSRGS